MITMLDAARTVRYAESMLCDVREQTVLDPILTAKLAGVLEGLDELQEQMEGK